MKAGTVAAEWAEYERANVPANASKDQRRETRKAYYAAFYACFRVCSQRVREEDFEPWAQALIDEMSTFQEQQQ